MCWGFAELKALLDYFRNPEKIQPEEETDLIRELDGFVDFANRDDDWRRDHMTYVQAQMDARNEGIALGRSQGIALGRTQGIAIGEARGERKGMARILGKLVNQGILSAGEASAQAGMSEKDFMMLLAEES